MGELGRPSDRLRQLEELERRLAEAVRIRLISDVPLGALLSGGVDSSLVVALMARASVGPVKTFSIGFRHEQFNEAAYARIVAERFGTDHHELTVDPDIEETLTFLSGMLEEPFGDSSMLPTYYVCRMARQHVTVALSGDGGDELFAGYPTFVDTPRLARLIRCAWFVPAAVRRMTAPLVAVLASRQRSPDAARKAAAAWAYPDALPHPYYFARTLFPPGQLERIIEPRFRPSTVGADGVTLEPTWLGWLERTADEARKLESVGGISWLEMRTYMASTLLRDTDTVSMARSLEVRVPLLDTPLVEFVGSLPDTARRRPGAQKALLAEALGDLLPQEILAQRKRTFTLPWEEWLRGPLRARIEASFADPAPPLASYLRQGGVRSVWADFLAAKTTWSRPWSLYVLNEWCRRHLAA